MTATVTDLFCGAGGSSLGAAAAGMEIQLAMNHWRTAIDVHQAQFPDAAHDCADISSADPRRYQRTDILLASPECTNHSQARGLSRRAQQPSLWDAPDPAAERSRATMWDVPRFAEQMRYEAIVVENVIEAASWVMWGAWRMAMDALGYQATVLSLNSMHFGVPQSRDRIYVVFCRKGLKVDLEIEHRAYSVGCGGVRPCRQAWKNGRTIGRYRQQWVWACTACHRTVEPGWVPASTIIDWALPCPRIGDRDKPLATRTRERIASGLARYGWLEPVVTAGAGNTFERTPGNRARPLSEPLPVQQASSTLALVEPPGFLLQTAHGGRVVDLADVHPTITASDDRHSLILRLRGTDACHLAQAARSTSAPLSTIAADGNHHGLLMRNNTARGNQGQMVTPLTEPARTITSAGHQSLLIPYYRTGRARPVTDPVPTVTSIDRTALVEAEAAVDDCGFRMLEPHEIAAAMAFPVGYIPDHLTKKDRVKLAGNAVTPPVITWPCARILHALESA